MLNYILLPFKGFQPKVGVSENPEVLKELNKLESERVNEIDIYKDRARQRVILHRNSKPNNKIRDYVRTTPDDDIRVDLCCSVVFSILANKYVHPGIYSASSVVTLSLFKVVEELRTND